MEEQGFDTGGGGGEGGFNTEGGGGRVPFRYGIRFFHSLVPRPNFSRPADSSKNRVWTLSL